MAPRNIQASLNFYPKNQPPPPVRDLNPAPKEQTPGSAPAKLDLANVLSKPASKGETPPSGDAQIVTINDVAGIEDRFNLDVHGFQHVKHISTERDFVDDEAIKATHYPEVVALLKKVTGATSVHIQSHMSRGPSTNAPATITHSRTPAFLIHIDNTPSAARLRLQRTLPALFPPCSGPSQTTEHIPSDHIRPSVVGPPLPYRYAMVNIWRPIKPILRDPLAYADASTVRDQDLVPIGLIYPERMEEFYSLRHNDGQKWYYKSAMQTDDVVIFKIFDSKVHGTARRTPHSAFVDPDANKDLPERESFEIRAFLFWEDQPLEG